MTSSKTVAVVDYGMGNLRSVSQAVQHVAKGSGFGVVVTSRPEDVMLADRIVLPGQGAIADCMHELAASGLLESVLHAAANKPLFGVCVGMQMLLTHSAEGRPGDAGVGTRGLGLIPGEVLKFDMPVRLMRATLRARRAMASASARRLRAIIFLQPSFTRKKAPIRAWPCTATS